MHLLATTDLLFRSFGQQPSMIFRTDPEGLLGVLKQILNIWRVTARGGANLVFHCVQDLDIQ